MMLNDARSPTLNHHDVASGCSKFCPVSPTASADDENLSLLFYSSHFLIAPVAAFYVVYKRPASRERIIQYN